MGRKKIDMPFPTLDDVHKDLKPGVGDRATVDRDWRAENVFPWWKFAFLFHNYLKKLDRDPGQETIFVAMRTMIREHSGKVKCNEMGYPA